LSKWGEKVNATEGTDVNEGVRGKTSWVGDWGERGWNFKAVLEIKKSLQKEGRRKRKHGRANSRRGREHVSLRIGGPSEAERGKGGYDSSR